MDGRRRIIAGTLVAVILVALLGWALRPQQAEAAYVTAPAARGSLTQQLTLVGPVARASEATLDFATPSEVTAVHVRLGDQVTAGQEIATIDAAPLRLAVLQARASVAQAEAQLDADLTARDNGGSRVATGASGAGAGAGGMPSLPTLGAGGLLSGMTGGAGSGASAGSGAGSGAGSAGVASGLPTGGLPGGVAGAAVPGEASGASPAYLTELTASLQAVQESVTTQQAVCQPLFVTLQRLREAGVDPGSLPVPTASAPSIPVPSVSPSELPSPTASGSPSPSAAPTDSESPTTTAAPPVTPTGDPTASPTGQPTASATPMLPTATPPTGPPATPGPSPSATDPVPTATVTVTVPPTALPTELPSGLPTELPTGFPTDLPTTLPTAWPTDLSPTDLTALLESFQSCSEAMVTTAQAEARAGAAILAASQGLADANRQAGAALAQAQAELTRVAQQAARDAAAEAMAQAQADIEQQIADQMAALAGGTVTDATIARDRATLLQARQQLDSAEADLAAATLTSPLSGTVGAIDFAVGESSAGRSATVVGQGAARVSVEVPLALRALVAPGTRATVGQLASPHPLHGEVVTVSVLPTSDSGTPSYSAEILADDPDALLPSGTYAEATLELRTASDVLTVPVSAVTKITDTTATVEVVDGARATSASPVTVVTGSSGGGRIQIVSGLSEGQLIVLADRRLPVPGGIDQYRPVRASASPTPSR